MPRRFALHLFRLSLSLVTIACTGAQPLDSVRSVAVSWEGRPDGTVQISARLRTDGSTCPILGDSTTAELNGIPLELTDGTYDALGGCSAAAFHQTFTSIGLTGADGVFIVSNGGDELRIGVRELIAQRALRLPDGDVLVRGTETTLSWSPSSDRVISATAFLQRGDTILTVAERANADAPSLFLRIPETVAPGAATLTSDGVASMEVTECSGIPECRGTATFQTATAVTISE